MTLDLLSTTLKFLFNWCNCSYWTKKKVGDKIIIIPTINFISSIYGLPFKFTRRQFPLNIHFTVIISKSHNQSLFHVGIYLPKPVFTHQQLYVIVCRVTSKKGLKIPILDEENHVCTKILNVVHDEIFHNV